MSYLNSGSNIPLCQLSISNQIHTETQHPNTLHPFSIILLRHVAVDDCNMS